ncbi:MULTISPECIES: FxsB family cyclophane-forming radical SAM/SPASM peptide maturase [unclassified Streptomyces]|uniref:FxsB family cyclophane-forming radical SAM/SPASM peptide maturase n=1 Tax=Streptomyces TaxID=1883 RepID=UPI001F177988|nr:MULTISPECIES: FxsB family cyclophane-forming radical SAM/SPASM peptide maturase [unclassified Streptomyces]MCU4749165.1 FxsB family radical SAM/SPASM domain protein [Streptomyces sp. G-5]
MNQRIPAPMGPEPDAFAPWPLTEFSVAQLRDRGVAAVPFDQFVVKVHSRCNLACRYCYMYFAADGGWRRQPVTASPEVLERAARRIAEHAAAHRLPAVSVVLHGGEPLLAGTATLAGFVARIRELVPAGCAVHAAVQTNGTLLTAARLRELAAARIGVGLSLDGGLAEHNAQRADHAGRPAWPAIRRAAALLAGPYRHTYGGVLCVVDPASDPEQVYRSLLDLDPPALNFLLPHANWSNPPPPGRYGDWLATVFDLWWDAGRRRTRIRLFQEAIALLLGAPAATESLGLRPVTAVVIETDGAIEQMDALKTAYEGAAATGLDIHRHPLDAALDHPGVAARQAGLAALSATCRACPLATVCGGGNYAHRYRAGEGFHHPSVYCADLQRLLHHIAHRVATATVVSA